MTIFKASFALVLVVCTGCAGRAPNPVSVVQVQDRYMDCPAIYAEVQSNNQRVQELAGDVPVSVELGAEVAARSPRYSG